MNDVLNNMAFRLMALGFKIRDLRQPRENILREAGIAAGFALLDYGCGSGSYVPAASRMVGERGRIYALDVHPLAVKTVKRLAAKKRIGNVETILSNCRTGLPDNSVDVVLLYDILHGLDYPDRVLDEIHRVVKPAGIVSVSDHHLQEAEIISRVTASGLFTLYRKGKMTLTFISGAQS